MAKKKSPTQSGAQLKAGEEWAERVEKRRKETPGDVDWNLCVEAVDSLQSWITELCLENHKLKQLLAETVSRLEKGNRETRRILKELKIK